MKRIALFLLSFCFAFTVHAQPSKHKKAIIVLTYDDGINSQLNIAIPQLDSAHLTGTFFLTGGMSETSIARWRETAKKGYELANHTLYHPCLLTTVKANPANNSAAYTPYMMLREINQMNTLLYALDGKTGTRTYAYPCTEEEVGGVNYVDTLRKAGLAKYARIGGGPDAVITDFKNLDPLRVPSFAVTGNPVTGEALIAFVKKVQQSGGMGVFMFHGVGGDYLITPADAHRQLLAYLKAHRDEIEVTTFMKAMDEVVAAK
ncbi:polysaccharide deacetylase family protein [Mucilaginibacter celer]|uniref:Polysaccharide deacetylase n=1 Tax=Mucilaginibacter celer TaxID=2305508 RepID=A0A494VS09_9SPHI|nr:polysaccharide deacetylase family protein [Mucilaginibacter celer]AYL94158.1 polysaccharide deacetylase [Mucilaginibacter celer]